MKIFNFSKSNKKIINKSEKIADITKYYNQLNQQAINIKNNYNEINYNTQNNTQNNHKLINTINNINIIGWFKLKQNNIQHQNFGDDLNYYFMQNIINTNNQIKYYSKKINKPNYILIGSIIRDTFVNDYTTIWGSGIITENVNINKPKHVCAVRGPKTRELLIKNKIQCPEIYGDPALLLPYYYYPYVQKKYKIGIIPHWSNINNNLVKKLIKDSTIKLINFKNYSDWKSVIKEILSCDFILSESLHGLIISDTYKIPNYYISFNDINQDFKYEDYFLSIGKTPYKPYIITETTTITELVELKNKVDNVFNINLQKLINACPFKLKNINLNNYIAPYTNKVLLCCIGKMENNYIREYVEYYKKLGFDNICLYDNNDINGEKFEDVINDYIESGFVILKNKRGVKLAQISSYTECYNEYKNDYDWIAFFDIDEFLHIDNNKSIKQLLSNDIYNDRGVNCIRICWKQFDDSNIIKTHGNYSIKKFKSYLPITHKDTAQTKIIIKTVLKEKLVFNSPHGVLNNNHVKCVNTEGQLCDNSILIKNITWKNACLHHYRFKTIEEYVLNKMVRLWPTSYKNGGKSALNLDMFFKYNKKTKDKIQYAKQLLKNTK